MPLVAAGAVRSPNIWDDPEAYEIHNRAADPERRIEAAMAEIAPLDGAHLVDIGCGSGFHLPRFAARASRVIGVEPHHGLAARARARVARLPTVSVRVGTAQRLPVPDRWASVAHARWAYFFGPGCEPGLAELPRVLRRGGVAFVIDIDATRSTYGSWFRRALPRYDPASVQRFWARQGFTRRPVDIRLRFADRAELAAVLAIEFPPGLAAALLTEWGGLEVDYAVNLWWRGY